MSTDNNAADVTSSADPDEHEFTCDLPGCTRTGTWAADDDVPWPAEPPPGWLSLVVARNGARDVNLAYCSQEHLGLGVKEHLPPAVPLPPDKEGWLGDVLGCAVVVGFVTVLVLGLISAVALLIDLSRWLVERF